MVPHLHFVECLESKWCGWSEWSEWYFQTILVVTSANGLSRQQAGLVHFWWACLFTAKKRRRKKWRQNTKLHLKCSVEECSSLAWLVGWRRRHNHFPGVIQGNSIKGRDPHHLYWTFLRLTLSYDTQGILNLFVSFWFPWPWAALLYTGSPFSSKYMFDL